MKQKLFTSFILCMMLLIGQVFAQNKISGKVTDSKGEPLAGVTISVKGATTSTNSGSQGEYSITVAQGATLNFKYVGYTSKDVKVTEQSIINVELFSDESEIEEVVVTGVGLRIDKRLFTGATARISGKDTEIGGMIDPSRGLEGRVAGVSVQNVTGTFGTAPKIRVRGATSIYGSSKPLWVVDGIILEDVADVSTDELSSGDALTLISSAVAGLNANDIESFQILKDGSATSIYGAKAMAGVIVITTKKGSAGRSSVNYSGEFTSRATPRYADFNIMNSQEQMAVYQEMNQKGYLLLAPTSNASSSGEYGKMYDLINRGLLDNTESAKNAYLRQAEYRNTNWFNELFSPNLQQNHSVSLSSGNDKSQYYASVSAVTDPGWSKQSDVDRYTGNLNAGFNILDNLKLNIITNGSYRDQKAPGTLGQSMDVVFGEIKRDFDINPYSYAMNTSRVLDPNTFYVRNYAPFNILHELDNNYMEVKANDVKFQGELRWKPITSLELSALGAMRHQSTAQHHHVRDQSNQATAYRWMPTTAIRDANPYLYTDPNDPFAVPVSILPVGGIYNRTDHSITSKQFRLTAQYDKVFNEKHNLTLFGLADISAANRNNTWFRGWGLQYDNGEYPFVDYKVFKRGQEENTLYYQMNNSRTREVAFAGNASYSYDQRYILNGTLRYEGTNRLGRSRESRWMPTWNISGAWNVHNESFFNDFNPILSHLMLKASYSLTGDRGPSSVTNSLAVLRAYNPWRPNTVDNESGINIFDLENSELTFEKKHEINLGLNAGFFNNVINLEMDWFKRNNFDLIGVVNTQGVGGQNSKLGNVAEMTSNGIELGVTANILRNRPFTWTSNFIYTHVKTKITKLETKMRAIDLITKNGFGRQGYAVRSLFSVPFVGLNNEGLPTFINQDGEETITDVYFQESEKLDFLKYSGSIDPTDIGSFGNTFGYKNLKLNVFMTYSFGNVVRLDPVFKREYSDLTATPKEFADRWVVPGDENFTNIPTIATVRQNRNNSNLAYAYNAYNYSDVRAAKGDFIRVKDVSLTYDFPKEVINPWKFSGLSVRLNATNLFLLYADKKLNGQDPEFINAGGVAAPIARQYTLTLRLGL